MAYTTIDRPEDYFKAKLHTGDASNHQTVNVGFRPDWIWLKSRTQTYSHYILDTSRQSDGSSMPSGDANMYNYLLTNATDAEAVAIGVMSYNNSARSAHAINMVIGKDDEILFFEPDGGDYLNLSKKQKESIWYLNF